MRSIFSILFALVMLPSMAFGGSLSIVTWNIDGTAFDGRQQEYKALIKKASPDIIILQELLGENQTKDFTEQANISNWNWYISDFSRDTIADPYQKLEVGIVSKYTLANRFEADPILEKEHTNESLLEAPSFLPSDQTRKMGARGYLWAEIPSQKLVVVAVHLKSSQGAYGNEDEENSFKREGVIAAVAERIITHSQNTKDYSYIVAGDFNIAPGDIKKVGPNINKRCGYDCFDYDQTHALLGGGLIEGFIMRNLTLGLGSSYKGKDDGKKHKFIDSPIDNIYVMGPFFDKATRVTAERVGNFGSDHYAISVQVESED